MEILINIASYWNEFCLVGIGAYALTLILGIISGISLFCDSIIGTIFSIILSPLIFVSGLLGHIALKVGMILLILDIVLKIIN